MTKKLNGALLSLTISLLILSGIAGSQIALAQGGEGDLGCSLLTGCTGTAHCDGRGTVTGCKILCETGPFISCGTGGEGN